MVYLGLFIIILAVFSYYRKKQTQMQDETEQQFFDREDLANHTRRQDISGLPYINIPLDKFPIGIHENNELKNYEKTINTLAGQKILNLGNQSNTDLKLAYGIANLDFLSACEQNYVNLCRTLINYAGKLKELGFVDEAVTVLEYGIDIDCDISKNYILLAQIYHEQGNYDRLLELKERALTLDSLVKSSILEKLTAIQESA